MEINNYIFFSIAGLINLIALTIIFFTKKTYDSYENKIYKILMISTIIGIINELVMVFCVPFLELHPLLKESVAKLFLLITELWIFLLCIYTTIVTLNIIKQPKAIIKKSVIKLSVVYAICGLITCMLPIEYAYNSLGDSWLYTYGPSTKMLFITALIFIGIIFITIMKNKMYIKQKKFIPVYSYIVLSTLVSFIQQIDPNALLISFVETLIILIMYFTIENPDMKLLEEVHKSKEISDNANEEKALFLYNMTQEIRNITNNINDNASFILDSNDYNEIYDSARDIMANTSKFTNMTNEILDVNTIDESTIKVYNSKYNLKNLLKQIVNIYSDICKDKELKFITNIDHDIPETIYGDSISLKEVLTTVLNNSAKYTIKGYVEFNVNTIIKNDICRLIFTIEDSGVGIKSEDVAKIKIDDKSLGKANRLITMMNGTMIISSDYGIGTKVKIILDQKIEKATDTEITKYESNFDNISILSVDDSESGLKIIEKLLKGTDIKLDLATTGKECLDKIKIGKYDLILLDEELSGISGLDLMKKIKAIRNFKTPVLLLTKDNSYEYNEEYLKIGFSDYILKPLKKETLLSKIDEYTKKDK